MTAAVPFAFLPLWGTILAGAAAVSVPVIIHLLNRRRYKVVVWAAMRFLLNAQKQTTRKMRLEQILLLAVRCTLVLLIVLAMASVTGWAEEYLWRPLFGAGAAPPRRTARLEKIIVLDASMSMTARTEDGKTCFDRARDLALQIVRESNPGDAICVALLKDAPAWVIAEPALDLGKARREIESLRPSHGNANVSALLNMVAAKLAETGARFDGREVYFITDLQRATWAAGQLGDTKKDARDRTVLQDIQQRAKTIFLDVGRDGLQNVAVTDVTLGDSLVTVDTEVVVMATIQHFGTEKLREQTEVELLVGRAPERAGDPPFALRGVRKELTTLGVGGSARVPLKHRFTEPGTYVVQVRVQDDDLPVDNARSFVVTVRKEIPALLVNGKPSSEPFGTATEFLRFALNPFVGGRAPASAPIRPRVLSVAQFADVNEARLGDYDCVFLCDVGRLGPAEVRRLEAHLRRGGGLVISCGDRVAQQMSAYNDLLYRKGDGILPGQLRDLVTAKPRHYYSLHADPADFEEPPLKAFAEEDDKISLRLAPFRQFIHVEPAADARARKVLSFMPEKEDPESKDPIDPEMVGGRPAILEWNPPLPAAERARAKTERQRDGGQPAPAGPTRYRGKVILVTTTLNRDWNGWPVSSSYGAMMQELFRLGASGLLREQSIVVGGTLEAYLPPTAGDADGRLYVPGEDTPQKVRTRAGEELSVFRTADTDVSGIYRLIVGNDPQVHLFAVNVPASGGEQRPSESDPARADRQRLVAAFPGLDFQLLTDLRDVQHPEAEATSDPEAGSDPFGPSIAHYLLLAVLCLLLVEVVLAWAFAHHTATPGASDPPRTGLLWPGLAAGVFLVLFVVLAGSLIHAAETGDFLGYLPDGFRAWVERALDIPPPAPGEGTRWHLEFTPYISSAANDLWLAGGVALAALLLVGLIYAREGTAANVPYKILLGGLRMFLILFTLAVLLPQIQLRFERQGWPDVVLLVDDSGSMGVNDHYRDEKVQAAADAFAVQIKAEVQRRIPERIKALEDQRQALGPKAPTEKQTELQDLERQLESLKGQLAAVESPGWRPTRLQLAQAILGRERPDWLGTLLNERKMKLHIFHLDARGRLMKLKDEQGTAGEVTDASDPKALARAREAIAALRPTGEDSRLGSAVRQILDYYRGASLTAVITLTDGVTTRDETLGQVAEYAAQKGVPLFFVGIGDDHDVRDLKLHDLQVEDTVYVNDRVIFEARLTGRGYKDITLPVVLKLKEKDGKEKELMRTKVRVDARGNPVKLQLRHQPTEPGEKVYIVEVEMPKLDRGEKPPNPADLRLQRTVYVQETKLIKALYIEGTPRYEFRFVKFLLEREAPDQKKERSIDLKVLLADADDKFPEQDRTAIADFPPTKQELYEYDVIILGDVDPQGRKLGDARLRDLADFVRERGGGLLMIAGGQYSPHAYKGTPLAAVLPIEPAGVAPVEADDRPDGYRPDLTPMGRRHPIFRFSADEAENAAIWNRLAPLYWWSEGYKLKPLAEVLATHPKRKAEGKGNTEGHPLVVQHFVGAGRCMFFGFDETWRWRFREDEARFNNFWIQTVRYLSRSRATRTTLRLDRQTPYRVGEPIKVTVQFPDGRSVPGAAPGKKDAAPPDVKVLVERKSEVDGKPETEYETLKLAKVEGSFATFEGILVRTREGKYKFTLMQPDVSKQQPSGEKPSAEAVVHPQPGEMDRLRMNQEEMRQAAEETQGAFYTLATADKLLEELPPGVRVALNTPRRPQPLWNHFLAFVLVLGLFGTEWLLRKRKHLL